MKKIFGIVGIALVLAVLATLAFSSVALADPENPNPAPINVAIKWGGGTVDAGGYPVDYGAGWISGTVTAGSTLATTNLVSAGNEIKGVFTANYNVGGGPYNGDIYTTSIDADVAGGGTIYFDTTRGALGYTSGGNLEPGGQYSSSFVGSSDTASMTTRTSASAVFHTFSGVNTGLFDSNYGWASENFRASGTYIIDRFLQASNGNFADVNATGSGTAALDVGQSSASGLDKGNQANLAYASGYLFGWNQDFAATGTGNLQLTGVGSTQVNFYNISQTNPNPGPSSGTWTGTLSIVGSGLQTTGTGTYGSAALQTISGFLNGLTCPNISMTAK